jgi:two-component system, sensor histidine kinase and response regulator
MDGITTTERIRSGERPTGSHIPIVAMTAHAMKGDRERCLAAGMDGYVSKPINAQELEDAIAAALHPGSKSHCEDTSAERPPASPQESTVSWSKGQTLEALGGDENLLQEVVRIFLEQAPKHLDALRLAIAQGDAAAIEAAAHSLKGELGYLCVPEIHRRARELEEDGRNSNLAGAAALLPQFEADVSALLHSMRSPMSVSMGQRSAAECSEVHS